MKSSILKVALFGVVAAAPLSLASASYAQTITSGTVWTGSFGGGSGGEGGYDRGANTSVMQRPRPDYTAEGIHAGGFYIYPKATVGVTYDDNIYALHNGALGDAIFTVAPEIAFQSTWSRNSLGGYVRVSRDQYLHYSAESDTQYGAGLNGKYEFGHSYFIGGVDYSHNALPRSVANQGQGSEHRIEYDQAALNGQLVHTFNRLRISARADYDIFDFQNGVTPPPVSAVVFEKDLNHKVATFSSKAEYAVSPDIAVFVTGGYNRRDYDLRPPAVAINRDSTGYEFDGGGNFDISHLVRGEIQLGYLDQSYAQPGFKDLKGLSARGKLEWFPTQLTTATFQVSRSVGDADIVGSAGYFVTNASAKVDHELRRNVILSANLLYGLDNYQSISRNDTQLGGGVSATYLLNRRVGLTAAYLYTNQQSTGTVAERGPSFQDNRISLSSTLQF